MREHLILATSYGTARADSAVPCVITQLQDEFNRRALAAGLRA